MKTTKALPLFLPILSLLCSGSLYAQSFWNPDASGDWGTPGNWTPTGVPIGAGGVVDLTRNISNAVIVNLNVNASVGVLNIGDGGGALRNYAITSSNGSTLTFDSGTASPAQLNFTSGGNGGNYLNNLNVALATDLVIRNNFSTAQRIGNGGATSINSTTAGLKTITNAGTGTGDVSFHNATLIGNTAGSVAIVQDSATSRLTFNNTANTFSGGFTLRQGTVAFGGGGLNIFGTGALTLISGRLEKIGTGSTRTIANAYSIQGDIEFADAGEGGANIILMTDTGSLAGGTRKLTVVSDTLLRLSGDLIDGGVDKAGAGVLEYTSEKSYTGATYISEGTLLLSDNGDFSSSVLGFRVSDASSGILQVENSAFDFSGTLDLDLASVGSPEGSWNLFAGSAFGAGDLNLLGITSNLSGLVFTENSGIWSGVSGSQAWSFTEATGQLTMEAIPEPKTVALVAAAGVIMAAYRRRARV